MKNVLFIEKFADEGISHLVVQDGVTGKILAQYTITDHSTDRGCMFLVHRTEQPDKAVWTDTYIQALQIAKADYRARG